MNVLSIAKEDMMRTPLTLETRRTRRRWPALFTIGIVGTALLQGCPKPPEFPIVPPIECWKRHDVDVLIAKLAVLTLEAYGRIDPQLYELEGDNGKFRISPNIKPINELREPDFARALGEVNQDEIAHRTLMAGHAAALEACRTGDCPPQSYRFEISVEKVPEENASIYHWLVLDDLPPTAFQWEQGFLRQYSSMPSECSLFGPALRVPDPTLPGHGEQLAPGGATSASSGKRYNSGWASEEPSYTAGKEGDCCEKTPPPPDSYGKLKKVGSTLVCRGTCPNPPK